MYQNWRQVISVPWTSYCEILISKNSFIDAFLNNLRYFFPSFPFKCPIEPGRYYNHNVTVVDSSTWNGDRADNFFNTVAAQMDIFGSTFSSRRLERISPILFSFTTRTNEG
jgi:Protein of unknown function (DUF1091)